jgi:type IV pilus assembly protein PilW
MVALVLGLIVTGAALALFVANRQTYLATESLGYLQENASTAFELMSRDLREAAGNPCDGGVERVTVLKTPSGNWYTDSAVAMRGYDGGTPFPDAGFGTAKGQRLSGTEAVEFKSSVADGVTIVSHNPVSAQFEVNTKAHDLHAGDIAMACDFNHAAIFQVTNAQPGVNTTIVHNTGGSVSPGNCTKGLGSPLDCSATGTSYEFGCRFGGLDPAIDCKLPENRWTAIIAKLKAVRWYVGSNGRGGTSLYRGMLRNNAGTLVVDRDEVAEGVSDMALAYLADGATSYVQAAAVADWNKVVAIRIDLALAGRLKAGSDGNPLQRRVSHVVAIRNRSP